MDFAITLFGQDSLAVFVCPAICLTNGNLSLREFNHLAFSGHLIPSHLEEPNFRVNSIVATLRLLHRTKLQLSLVYLLHSMRSLCQPQSVSITAQKYAFCRAGYCNRLQHHSAGFSITGIIRIANG